MSIKLYTKDGLEEPFTTAKSDLKGDEGDFKLADVKKGTWIFYSNKDFNDAQLGASASNYKILRPGDRGVDISSVNGSMDLLQDDVEGFVLFEHFYYGGKRKYYQESCDDFNSDFPVGKIEGVSSAIILSQNQNFEAFTKSNYQGPRQILKAGTWYATSGEMKFPNDKLRSIRRE